MGDGDVDTRAEDLADWIGAVRARLARGELADLGVLDLGDGTPPMEGELLVRIMLADFDHFDDLTPMRRREPDVVARRRALLQSLHRLRERIR